MKKKSFISFFMLLLTLILSISGFSAWVLTKNTGDINLNDRMHTINVYYQKSEITNETIVLKDETVETNSNSYSGMYGSTAYDYYNKYQLNPEMSTEDLFDELDLGKAPETSYPTIGGLVYELCEEPPFKGKVVKYETIYDNNDLDNPVIKHYELSFTIDRVIKRRIKSLILEIKEVSDDEQE